MSLDVPATRWKPSHETFVKAMVQGLANLSSQDASTTLARRLPGAAFRLQITRPGFYPWKRRFCKLFSGLFRWAGIARRRMLKSMRPKAAFVIKRVPGCLKSPVLGGA
jgi:hypothetical protein